ncbi:hypothetical protein GCM10020331_066260 [Ectobacillus funiculus]
MVMCADKLHNIRATVREFEAKGDDVWGRFNRGKEKARMVLPQRSRRAREKGYLTFRCTVC